MCEYCCWAFPVDQGIWMGDWDEDLVDVWGSVGAIPAAHEAAATPLTRAMLDLCSCDMELPFSGSPKAMARLLDIAILTGNQKAAVNLAKKCQLRPLRRWKLDFVNNQCWQAARTALWAGADFPDLMVKSFYLGCEEGVPFPPAMFLRSKLEDWQEIRHLLPRRHDLWRPRNSDNELGKFFLERPQWPDGGKKLALDKIRAAEDAGVEIRFCSVSIYFEEEGENYVNFTLVTLLDVAIWYGQPDCAKACVDGGIELQGDDRTLAWHQRVLRGESLRLERSCWEDLPVDVVPSEAQIAAAAAGRAWLKRSWKSESSQKGIVLHQMFKGRSSSVQEILTFSMPVPKILDQLDLREHVEDWMATICGRPAPVHAATECNTANVEDPEGMQDSGEAGALLYIEVLVLFFMVCFQG